MRPDSNISYFHTKWPYMQPFVVNASKHERQPRKLADAVEALLNIFYLLERERENPEKLREYLTAARPVMALLKEYLFQQYEEQSRKEECKGIPMREAS